MNELKVVNKIEESLKNARGPRIQIIKSRELRNARSFAEKIFRVLKLHGYKVEPLNTGNFNRKVEKSEADSLAIYSIDEPTIKEILGEGINETPKPIRALFDNSMLSYMKAPVLIVVVTDEFYGETGLQSYAQSLDQQNAAKTVKKAAKKEPEKSGSNMATLVSFYLAAAAFFFSGLNTTVGNYLSLYLPGETTYAILPLLILLVSIAAIAARAISIGNESRASLPLVVGSILLFIILTLLSLFNSLLPSYLGQAILNSDLPLIPQSMPGFGVVPPTALVIVFTFAFYLLAMLRYILYLGRGSGRAAYALTIFGIFWITVLTILEMPQSITELGNIVTSVSPGGLTTSFPTDFPLFGFNYSVNATGSAIPTYLVFMNDLIMIGNFMMALGLLLAAKSQKALWGSAGKSGKISPGK